MSNKNFFFVCVCVCFLCTAGLVSSSFGTPINVAAQSNGGTATAISYGTYLGYAQYPWQAIDGDSQTGWSSNWDMPAWLQVEFLQAYTIDSLGIWWGSHKHDYSVSLSLDGTFWSTVLGPQQSINEENSTLEYEFFDIAPIEARYLRIDITSTSAPSSHIFQASVNEIEAYTNPVPEPGSMLMMGIGLLMLSGFGKKIRKKNSV